MIKTFSRRVFLVGTVLMMQIFYAQYTYAQEPCGSIVQIEEGEEFSDPIEDCDFPFGPIHTNETLSVSFNGTQLENGGTYPLAGEFGSLDISELSPFSFSMLYKHRGNDYVLITYLGQPFTFTAGTYSLYVLEEDIPVLTQNILQKLFAYITPTAHAAIGDSTLITFTVTEPPPPEPEIPELILQYAPILYFHEDEDYFPMDVESFVEASSLWSQEGIGDTQLHSSFSLTFEKFEEIIESGEGTSDYYLAFSDPDTAKSIDIGNAHTVYDNIRKKDAYATTTYYRKMTDDGYTVLQYWYFYAMNNWGESGGFNNHEGDWESVFIYLDEDTQVPEYVAYSAHHNDGNPELHPLQYDSVRREWGSFEITKEDDQVVSFVAEGSHANYPNNNADEHTVPSFPDSNPDETSLGGEHLSIENFNEINTGIWPQYQGKWGADSIDILDGKSGPLGPKYSEVSGHNRFANPVQWAGIDKIVHRILTDEALEVLFPKQEVQIQFAIVIPSGTTFDISPHEEAITFGIVADDVTMLPHFWDIESSLENGTFDAQITLPYNLTEVQVLGGDESQIAGAYYDPVLNTWTTIPATVNTTAQTAAFFVPHFSRYALVLDASGFEELEIEDIVETVVSKQSQGTRIERQEGKVAGVSISSLGTPIDKLSQLVSAAEMMSDQNLSPAQKYALLEIVNKISLLLRDLST